MPTGETPRFELAGTTAVDAAAVLLATAFAGGADTRAARARALVGSHSTWVLRGHHDAVLAALAAGPTLDAEVVGLYVACGLSTHSLGEVCPGVERFRCVLLRP